MYIKITDNTIETDGQLNFQEAMRLLASAMLQVMNKALDFASNEEEYDAVRDSVYDSANQAFTAILDSFDPDQSRNDDLDINIVVAMQDQIIQEALETIKEYNPKRYKRLKRNADLRTRA